MLTAMRAVDNLLHGTDHDIWAVNAESRLPRGGRGADEHPYPYRDGADVPALREPVSESA